MEAPTKTITTSDALALDIVRDGAPRAEIVVDKNAHAGIWNAAWDLQKYIREMSGAMLRITSAPDKDPVNYIYVGDNEFTKRLGYKLPEFSSSGYDILIAKDYAVLSGPNTFYPPNRYSDDNLEEFREHIGEKINIVNFNTGGGGFRNSLQIHLNDDIGAWHAVSALLEQLGVRFYAPYEDGTVIPQKKDIILEGGRETKQAAFERRQLHANPREDRERSLWLKRMKCGVRTGIICNHTTRGMIGNPEMRQIHPSWYAEESPGKLFDGFGNQGGVPRYTDPDFLRICVKWARMILDTHPNLAQVTVGGPDDTRDEETGDPYDWRDQKIYQKPGMTHQQAYANMMWDFHVAIAKELKKSHPDKFLIWWCLYNDHVPTNIDPNDIPDNILVRVEAIAPTNYVLNEKREEYWNSTKALFAAFKPHGKSQQWEWWLDYVWPTSPRFPEFSMHQLQQMRQQQQKYFDGFFMEVAPDANSGRIAEVPIVHLMLYVNNKLMWNPDLDMNALLEEYYQLWFGPAEEEMKAFHEYAEAVWMRQGTRSVSEINGFLKREDVPKYFELLDAAKAKTTPGTVYYERIDAMEKSYAGLRTVFDDRTPNGEQIEVSALPNDTQADGDFSKYKGVWRSLHTGGTSVVATENGSEFNVALSQDKNHIFVAVRCIEENMKGLVENAKTFDQKATFKDDHVEINFNTPERHWFTIAVNPALAIWDETRDLDLINYYALPVYWTPGTTAHVKKMDDRWELEVAVPTRDFGDYGPTSQYPWGFNISRVRMAGAQPEMQSFMPQEPAHWARMVLDETPLRKS